jgi:hypothetical protein
VPKTFVEPPVIFGYCNKTGSVAKRLWFLIYAFGNIKQQPRICIDEFEKSIQVASF